MSDAFEDGASLPKGANMTRGSVNKLNGVVRPIKTKKDYSGAASVIEKITEQPDRETVAEKRLQSLLKAMLHTMPRPRSRAASAASTRPRRM